MAKEDISNVAFSKNVIEFVTVAKEYCSFLEGHKNFSRADFIDRLHKLLPLIYLKATLLPLLNDESLETPEKFVSEVDYNFLLGKISSKLGQFDSYQEVFMADMQFSESALDASISENICDIYQDLKDFVMAYRIGTNELMTDAVWECKNNFCNYWGQKLVNGLRAIHSLRYSDLDLNEDQIFKNLERNEEENDEEEDDGSWVSKHFNNYSENDELDKDGL